MSRYYNGYDHEEFESDDELYHFGILGMHWGKRRFQNEDGSLTPAGRERYGYFSNKRSNFGNKTDKNREKVNSKGARINKNVALKVAAGLAVTAAGAYAVYKITNSESGKVTTDSLQKNFSDAFDLSKGSKVTSDSLQKNFSDAFDLSKGSNRKPDRVTSDSLQKNFSDAFDLSKGSNRKQNRVTSDSLQKNFSDAFDLPKNASSRTSINRTRSSGTQVNQTRSSGTAINQRHSTRSSNVTSDSLQKNFSDAFDLPRGSSRTKVNQTRSSGTERSVIDRSKTGPMTDEEYNEMLRKLGRKGR